MVVFRVAANCAVTSKDACLPLGNLAACLSQ